MSCQPHYQYRCLDVGAVVAIMIVGTLACVFSDKTLVDIIAVLRLRLMHDLGKDQACQEKQQCRSRIVRSMPKQDNIIPKHI